MALIERIQNTTDATHWRGKIPMEYVYTAGRAGEVFFSKLKEKGEFTGARCDKCGITYLPPSIFCEKCFARLEDSYVTVENRGVVLSFTRCHESYDEKPKDEPSIVAMIRMAGTDGAIAHRLGGVEFADVHVGMEVEAVLKPQEERAGGLLDIEHFRPVS